MLNHNDRFLLFLLLKMTNLACHKVALYHSYLPIKFDDDIQGGPLILGVSK